MTANIRIKMNVTINGTDATSEYFAECCGEGCGVHDVEEMSRCVECGKYFCMDHDWTCPVDSEDRIVGEV